ncbi:MAG: NUDIX hydrolase [Fournierella sp.]|uniref:NUDIX hydrolase n=1 Tax=Allofournierella sp. TaxID=1940256 RepID=UPI002A84036C|nr:NUDIX hydrolase [Fournierella sp.]MDY4166774.1 NUDIX hydrolase [Fournierella sp.]
MAHFEKTLNSDTRFEGRVFTVTVDKVELENGRTSTREVVHHHGGACIAALTENDEIYLVRQFRYAFGQELWELPAGKLEKGEDPFEAARRELGEECGLTAEHFVDLGPVYPTVGYCTEIIYCWAATGLSPCGMHLDEDEFLTPEKVPFDRAVEMVLSGEIRDGKTVAALLKIKALRDAGRM